MDWGAWWAAVHEVAKSRTRLRDFTFTFHFHALEKEMATHSSVLVWRIPGTGEPGGLPSMGSHRVGHDWSDSAAAAVVSLFSPKRLLPLDSLTSHFPGSLLFYLPTFQTLWPATISTLILNQQCYPRYLARFHFPLFFTVTPKQFLFNFHQGGQLNVRMLRRFSRVQLCDPMDYSPPHSSVHGVLQARMLEWVTMTFSRGSSWPRNQTYMSYVSCIGRWVLYY